MANWSTEQTHEWLMRILHEKYVEDEQASMRWPETLEATELHPCGDDIIRESKQLASYGWIEILTQAYGFIFAQMTRVGCETWEAFLGEKENDPAAVLSPP
jgi:hypothetical protein